MRISGKQKRNQMRARRLVRAARRLAAAQQPAFALRPPGTVAVDAALLGAGTGGGAPDFLRRGYYQDLAFRCVGCGALGVWSAARQKWWYEVAGGDLASTARRCAACRAQERQRKFEARQRSLAGLEQKAVQAKRLVLP